MRMFFNEIETIVLRESHCKRTEATPCRWKAKPGWISIFSHTVSCGRYFCETYFERTRASPPVEASPKIQNHFLSTFSLLFLQCIWVFLSLSKHSPVDWWFFCLLDSLQKYILFWPARYMCRIVIPYHCSVLVGSSSKAPKVRGHVLKIPMLKGNLASARASFNQIQNALEIIFVKSIQRKA